MEIIFDKRGNLVELPGWAVVLRAGGTPGKLPPMPLRVYGWLSVDWTLAWR
jgi:hypothetical protein